MAETQLIDTISIIIGTLVVIGIVILLIRVSRKQKKLTAQQQHMSAPETVRAQVWNSKKKDILGDRQYTLFMKCDDGREIRLDVPRDLYMKLHNPVLLNTGRGHHNVRIKGLLTYQGTQLLNFVPDPEFQEAVNYR